ncbi:hypothetical protein VOLCADRAFT_100215, partial [Volvox carteri f. nagariensis]
MTVQDAVCLCLCVCVCVCLCLCVSVPVCLCLTPAGEARNPIQPREPDQAVEECPQKVQNAAVPLTCTSPDAAPVSLASVIQAAILPPGPRMPAGEARNPIQPREPDQAVKECPQKVQNAAVPLTCTSPDAAPVSLASVIQAAILPPGPRMPAGEARNPIQPREPDQAVKECPQKSMCLALNLSLPGTKCGCPTDMHLARCSARFSSKCHLVSRPRAAILPPGPRMPAGEARNPIQPREPDQAVKECPQKVQNAAVPLTCTSPDAAPVSLARVI